MLSHEDAPRVTVAVLAYNRRDSLRTTLRTVLEDLDYPRERLEVIVVDNASEDGTEAMVREEFPDVRLIVNPLNEGIGGWNRAFAVGTGDWFLVLDDDCTISGDALQRALAAAQEHGADLVSFAVDGLGSGPGFTDVYPTGMLMFWGCAALISRRAIVELGGFDGELFIWAHELDFTMRLLDRGMRHLHLPEVRALHMKPVVGLQHHLHMRNMHNWAYIATRLQTPLDAALTVASLVVRAGIEAVRYAPYWTGVPAVLRGALKGLRRRQPVRPAVSHLYRRDFIDFTSHARPRQRLRHLLGRGPDFRTDFWRRRPRLYPRTAASLRIPLTARRS